MEMTELKKTVPPEGVIYEPSPDKSEYPPGLRLELDNDTLKKLGISELPKLGEKFLVMAKAEVASANQHKNDDGKHQYLGLQLVEMCLHPDKPEINGPDTLYPKK